MFAVYSVDEVLREDGTYENDFMDWFDSEEEEARTFAQERANESRKTVYVIECDDGDFGDESEEFFPQ